jgi:hypothetical protein
VFCLFIDVFAAFHPPSAYATLSKFQVGELRDDEKEPSGEIFIFF